MKLTGYQRFTLVRLWYARYKDDMTKEHYVKRVCKEKNIEYVEPTKNNRKEVK